jgi:hypothetical protein
MSEGDRKVVPFHRDPPASIEDQCRRYAGFILNSLTEITNNPKAPASVRKKAQRLLDRHERLRRQGLWKP